AYAIASRTAMWRASHTPKLIAVLSAVLALWSVLASGCPRDHSRACGRAARRRAPAPVHTRKLHHARGRAPAAFAPLPRAPALGRALQVWAAGGTWTITATNGASWRQTRVLRPKLRTPVGWNGPRGRRAASRKRASLRASLGWRRSRRYPAGRI